jgi:hypothetical protein
MIFSDVSSHEPVDPTVNIRAKKRRREENDFDENESEDEPPSKKSWIYPNETENLDD